MKDCVCQEELRDTLILHSHKQLAHWALDVTTKSQYRCPRLDPETAQKLSFINVPFHRLCLNTAVEISTRKTSPVKTMRNFSPAYIIQVYNNSKVINNLLEMIITSALD